MKRWILGLALLAACGGRTGSGPSWPKAAESEEDGGESLEPQHASNVAAVERAEDRTPAIEPTEVVEVTAPAPAMTPAAPAVTPAMPAATPEPTVEVIEIKPEDIPANP